MKYIILGGGWYGNFLGLIFKLLNIEFIILEKNIDIFMGSSSKNQNRLHLGYHYPRSQTTREECILGYDLFMRLFSFMINDVENNYYLIEKNSEVLYDDYIKIYEKSDVTFERINMFDNPNIKLNMDNIEGIIKCEEKLINHNVAYSFFKKILENNTILNYDKNKLIIDNKNIYYGDIKYDKIINCTYGQEFMEENLDCEYELCMSLIYKGNINCAITLMDGPFFSIYPYTTNKYTLTDVQYTPLVSSRVLNDVLTFQKNLNNEIIIKTKLKMEEKVKKYLINFDELFTYDSYNISYKCKFKNSNDDRSVKFYNNNNILSFIGGKITGIFSMANIISKELLDDRLHDVYDIIESKQFRDKYGIS